MFEPSKRELDLRAREAQVAKNLEAIRAAHAELLNGFQELQAAEEMVERASVNLDKKQTKADRVVADAIAAELRNVGTWNRAINICNGLGLLEGHSVDAQIGTIKSRVCGLAESQIKELLYERFGRRINQKLTDGLACWYKNKLAFEAEEQADEQV